MLALILIGGVALAAIVGTAQLVRTDGHRRVPTRPCCGAA